MDLIKDTASTLKAHIEYALLFHMERMITLDEQVLLLKKLHTLYGTNYVHRVPEERGG